MQPGTQDATSSVGDTHTAQFLRSADHSSVLCWLHPNILATRSRTERTQTFLINYWSLEICNISRIITIALIAQMKDEPRAYASAEFTGRRNTEKGTTKIGKTPNVKTATHKLCLEFKWLNDYINLGCNNLFCNRQSFTLMPCIDLEKF